MFTSRYFHAIANPLKPAVQAGTGGAANFKNSLYIKEIRRHEDGIYLISRNKDYEPISVTNSDGESFQILGRMVWRGG